MLSDLSILTEQGQGRGQPRLRRRRVLWGECISGALAEDEFTAEPEKAGFFGVMRTRMPSWYYPEPKPAAQHIRGMVAFWRGVEVI